MVEQNPNQFGSLLLGIFFSAFCWSVDGKGLRSYAAEESAFVTLQRSPPLICSHVSAGPDKYPQSWVTKIHWSVGLKIVIFYMMVKT